MRRLNKAVLRVGSLLALTIFLIIMTPSGADGELAPSSESQDGRVAFGRSLRIDSPISGDVELIGGSAAIDSEVKGNVVVFGGNINLGPRASVTGDVIAVGGKITTSSSSKVEGRMYSPASPTGALGLASRGGIALTEHGSSRTLLGAAVSLSLLFLWLIAAVLVSTAASRDIRFTSTELVASPFYSFTIGLIALTSFVLTAVVFSYLVPYLIGIPLLAALGLFALFTKIYGMVAVFHAVGAMIARPRDRDDLKKRKWMRGDLAMVVVGLIILGLIRMVPYVGAIVWMGASIFGTGVALATRFGKREPWFLQWHPSAALEL